MARKAPSPQVLKMRAANRRPYTPAQEMAYVPCGCDPRYFPSQKSLDDAADLRFSGGFKIFRGNICPVCSLAKSVNGTCGC